MCPILSFFFQTGNHVSYLSLFCELWHSSVGRTWIVLPTGIFSYSIEFVAQCPVPEVTHGTVFPYSGRSSPKRSSSNNCTNGMCVPGDYVFFLCDAGYYLSGYGYLNCIGRGEWNRPIPTCEGKFRSWIYSAIHKAAGLTVPGHSMIWLVLFHPSTIPSLKLSMGEWSLGGRSC